MYYNPFERGIHCRPVESPFKGSAMPDEFPCHDVIIDIYTYQNICTFFSRTFGFQFTCRHKGSQIPYAVSLVASRCELAKNVLYLPGNKSSNGWHNFTMCTTPFFYNYNNVMQLVEYIEVNRMFGVDHFVFYNLTMGANVNRYLRYYMSTGTVEVIQWHLPRGNATDSYGGVHYFAQVTAYQDCLLRSLQQAIYISFTDLDELIVPRVPGNWSNLMKRYQHELTNKCSLLIRNAFFRIDWSSDPDLEKNTSVKTYKINTLLKTLREFKIWKSGSRSKYIAKVSHLVQPGIHFPLICRKKIGRWFTAETTDALLHHYRSWEDASVHDDAVRDTFMVKYAGTIVQRIQNVHEKLGWLVNYGARI